MIHANLNQVSQDTLQQLAILAKQNGLSVEDYHQEILRFWVKFPINLHNFEKKSPIKQQDNQNLTSQSQDFIRAELPKKAKDPAKNRAFIEHLLNMPKLDGYDDVELFLRSQEPARVVDFGE